MVAPARVVVELKNLPHNLRFRGHYFKFLPLVHNIALGRGADPIAVRLPPLDDIAHLFAGVGDGHFVDEELETDRFDRIYCIHKRKVWGVPDMEEAGTITVISNKQEITLDVNQILYVQMQWNSAFIHISRELVYQTRMTLTELEGKLGGNFIKVKRGCLVSAMAIHNVTDKINLCKTTETEKALAILFEKLANGNQ